MRIAALGFKHETNTFQSVKTDYDAFVNFEFLRGSQIAERHASTNSVMNGFLKSAAKFEFELVPLLLTITGPTGTVTKDAFDRITAEMIQMLKDNAPWDGVLLAQHGGAVSEEFPDMDGEIARLVKQAVGQSTPVAMTFDLHSNITQKQIENTEAILVYRTNPHIDQVERGLEASEILVRTIRGEIDPIQHLVQVPMIINITRQATAVGAMKTIMDDVAQVVGTQGVLSASCGQGFPYADVEHMGVSFLVISNGDPTLAKTQSDWLARRAWDRRSEFLNSSVPVDKAIAQAMDTADSEKPTVILDVGDNVGGGGTADSTHLLAEAIRQEIKGERSLLVSLFDPASVRESIAAGPGATVSLKVGAKTDELHGKPIAVTGRVRVVTDGRFEETGQIHGGWRFFDYGPSVALDTDDGYTIVLHTERGVGNMSRQQYYSMGIFPEQYQTVICKGTVSPRPAYEPIAGEMIMADTPGVTSAIMASFDYRSRRKPLYPFELDTTFH